MFREEAETTGGSPAGSLLLGSTTRSRHTRTAATQAIVFGQDVDPDASIAALDAVSFDAVRAVAAGISEGFSVACVGPHTADEFAST